MARIKYYDENTKSWRYADTKGDVTYTLPIASESTLGGVKPVANSEDMTQSVGIDENGLLWTVPQKEAVLYTPQALTPEQQAQARQNLGLDELPTGGSDDVLLADFTLENDVTGFTVDSNDTETKFKALYFELIYYSSKTDLNGEATTATHLWVYVNDAKCFLGGGSTTANVEGCVYGWLNLTEFNSFGFVIGAVNKSNTINGGGSYTTRIISGTQPQQNFIRFRCYTHNGVNLIGAGTHLRVWGVKA